ncbi:hypothetical protein EV127DRAFT_415023 [Xylaria flabelliformis]|nr:hypothetical protein EV127DRAFT_415023 [Xylaria flabelliformis]
MANRADRFKKAKILASSLHDDDIAEAIKKYITLKWYRPCFTCPEDDPLLWIKFVNKRGFDCIEVEPSIKSTPEQQRESLRSTLRDQYAEPPRVRIPELFPTFQTTDFKAIAMEPVQGPTLDWLMRCEYHVIDASFGWVPTPHQKIHDHLIDLSVSERQLSDYADATGLLLLLPMPMDAAPGPVGGGHSRHLIFENESLGEDKSPREYQLVQELTEHINEVAQPWISPNYRLADFSHRMCYVMSDLNNGNVIFGEGEVDLMTTLTPVFCHSLSWHMSHTATEP